MLIRYALYDALEASLSRLDLSLRPQPSARRVKRLAEGLDRDHPTAAELVTIAAAALAGAEAVLRQAADGQQTRAACAATAQALFVAGGR